MERSGAFSTFEARKKKKRGENGFLLFHGEKGGRNRDTREVGLGGVVEVSKKKRGKEGGLIFAGRKRGKKKKKA